MANLPGVTVIVLNLNGLVYTPACIKSVLSSAYKKLNILIIDNGSTSDEAAELRRLFPSKRIKIIKTGKNLGFARANNIGAKMATSKYVIFLNNDTIVDRGWLTPLVTKIEGDRLIVACQPKIRSAIKKQYFDYAGAAGGFIDKFGFPFARGRIFFNLEEDTGQYKTELSVHWACGVAMMVDRKTFLKFGGFDEDYFIYHEETDICWKFLEKGLKIYYVPESVVYHYGMGFTGSDHPRRIFLLHRNMWLMTLKHLSLAKLLTRPLFDVASIFFYLFHREFGQAASVFKCYIWLLQNPNIVRRKRKYYRKSLDDSFLYNRSIVLDYFIFGKKKFSQLKWL